MNPVVENKFKTYPEHIKTRMVELRQLILDTASETDGVDNIEETLKWDEPAYLTRKPKSGTTIRIDWKEKSPEQIGFYVSCSTGLIAQYKTIFGDELKYEGKRAILLPLSKPLPKEQLTICIRMALRYHLDK